VKKMSKNLSSTKKSRDKPRNPLVPKLNDHKNQFFKDKKKENNKNVCREKVKSNEDV